MGCRQVLYCRDQATSGGRKASLMTILSTYQHFREDRNEQTTPEHRVGTERYLKRSLSLVHTPNNIYI